MLPSGSREASPITRSMMSKTASKKVRTKAGGGAAGGWRSSNPSWRITPRCTRYNGASRAGRRLVLHSGSSIGGFWPGDAVCVLRGVRAQLSPGDCLLLGTEHGEEGHADAARPPDARCGRVTARFNLNVLVRINRELDARFNPQLFCHRARWNEQQSRIDTHLESLLAQSVAIRALDMQVHFSRGETCYTH